MVTHTKSDETVTESRKMFEPSEEVESYRCTHCSYLAVWSFQLYYHIQRKHKNVNSAKLSCAVVKPEEYPCIGSGFKSFYKLDQYELCISPHDPDENNESGPFHDQFKKYQCDYCKYDGHSLLYFTKHSCKVQRADTADEITLFNSYPVEEFNFDQHRKEHATCGETDRFNCTRCSYQTGLKADLKVHLLLEHGTVDEVEWFNCGECSYRTEQETHLKDHMLVHVTGINWFKCTECFYKTNLEEDLKEHIMLNHKAVAIEWFSCVKCSYRTNWKASLTMHFMSTHGTDEMETDDMLLEHTTNKDRVKQSITGYEDKTVGLCSELPINYQYIRKHADLKCAKCSYKTIRKSDLKRHNKLRHATVSRLEQYLMKEHDHQFNCTRCSYQTDLKSELKKHLLLEHETVDEIEWFSCGECTYRTQQKTHLQDHMMAHITGINWFKCTQCFYRTNLEGDLKEHMLTHKAVDIEWFYCVKCSYRTINKGTLSKHFVSVHEKLDMETGDNMPLEHATDKNTLQQLRTDDKNTTVFRLCCNSCSYRCKQKYELRKHMLKHADLNNIDCFSCSKCSYKTKQKHHLKRHMRKHAKAEEMTWFNCCVCSFRTKEKHLLNRHLQNHATSGETGDQFSCTHCSYQISLKEDFEAHMLQHAKADGKKWFNCSECSYRTERKPHLKCHVLKHKLINIDGSDVPNVTIERNEKEN